MGLTGDTLSFFSLFAGSAVSAAVGAVSTKGQTRDGLWVAAGLFAVIALGVAITSARFAWGDLLPIAFATTSPITVIIVALMLRRARLAAFPAASPATKLAPQPAPKARRPGEARQVSKWEPDITLADAASYLRTKSTWRAPYDARNVSAEANKALREALSFGQLTSWGREHPKEVEYQLDPEIWSNSAQIKISENYIFSPKAGAAMHSVRLSRGELEAAWPPKKD